MARRSFTIKVKTEDLRQAIKRSPRVVAQNIRQAGSEAGETILNTQGLRRYPPATEANLPPTPYYVRGRGTQYSSGNAGNSKKYGTKWFVRSFGSGVKIGNTASYAPYVGGREQPLHMHRKGWRKLHLVARSKRRQIKQIFEKWVTRALRQVGL